MKRNRDHIPARRLRMARIRTAVLCLACGMVSHVALADEAGNDSFPAVSGSLTLEDAVRTALAHSPLISAAQARVSAAQARVGVAGARTRPQLGVVGVAGTATMAGLIPGPPDVTPSGTIMFRDRKAAAGQLMLMIPLYTGGRLSAAVRATRSQSSAVSADRSAIEHDVAFETKRVYYHALYARAVVEVYRRMVDERRERVRIADAAFQEGSIAKYDLLRNQTDLAAAEQELADAERDAEVALIDLKTIMGVDQESDFALADKLTYTPTEGGLEAALTAAGDNRPEIAAADVRVQAAESDLAVAKAAYRPQVYIVGMQGSMSTDGESESGHTVGITAGLPLLDGGLRRSAVREAESMLDAAKSEARQTLLLVQRDVRTAWAELQAADKKVKLSEAAVAQAEEDYRVIRLRYEAGKAINVQVLDALTSLVQSETGHLSALEEYATAQARVARAIGRM